jgi:branched-chain amino acid transport system substrate-binding protein
LTALAAERAQSNEPVKMKEAFASNIRGKQKCSTYAECKKLLDKGKTIDYQGASAGFSHMNKFGRSEPNAGVYDVWAFDNTGHSNADPPDKQIRIG